jgi:hypothetical protein
VAVGVIIFFIVNIIFVQRIYCASHPHLGWARWFSALFTAYYVVTIWVIIMLITGVIQSFYTLRLGILSNDKDLLLFGSTYFAVAAFLPIPLLAIRAVLPTHSPRENFGDGRFGKKIAFLLVASAVLTLGAAFRAGTAYVPRPLTNPAWYHSKACFYVFDFTIDISMVIFYAVCRIDKMFIIPNGSKGPGDFSRPMEKVAEGKDAGEETVSAAPTAQANGLEQDAAKKKSEATAAPVPADAPASADAPAPAAAPATAPSGHESTTAPATEAEVSNKDPTSEN